MKLLPYFLLMRLHRPVGIFLLLWPTYWAFFCAAGGFPSLKNLFVFTLGVILMRSAGCVMNDIADRHFDRWVARTRDRPLTTGQLPLSHAFFLTGILCVMAFILVCLTNLYTVLLACVAVLLAMLYPFMKRYTHWPQFVLGLAFSMAIPMAYTAESNTVFATTFVLWAANIAWVLAYDTQYAMADMADDINIGIKSTALLFGQYSRLMIALFQVTFLVLLFYLGKMTGLSSAYFLTLALVCCLFLYQQYLIWDQVPKKCSQAFSNNQWVGAIICLALLIQ